VVAFRHGAHGIVDRGHCGVANSAFAAILRGEELPLPSSPEEADAQIRAGGRDVASREVAVKW
jgi:hypothetical protein